MTLDPHQLIVARLDEGCPLAQLERELEERVPWLEPEERDALWLYAWSLQDRRREALAARV